MVETFGKQDGRDTAERVERHLQEMDELRRYMASKPSFDNWTPPVKPEKPAERKHDDGGLDVSNGRH